MQQMVNSDSRFTTSQQPIDAALGPRSQSGLGQQGQLTTINQSQLGLATHNSPSPPGSKSATPSPSSSVHEDENDDTLRVTHTHTPCLHKLELYPNGREKRPAAFDTPKKAKTPKKKKRKDPNEPVKPVSAYALFFRDTQANIKAQNPNATFGEVSKIIVASMWDGLGEEPKQVYKKRTETAKKEYLKQLAAYRASLVSQSYNDPSEMKPPLSSSPSPSPAMFTPKPTVYPGHQGQQHPSHPGHQGPSLSPHLHSQLHPQLQALSSRGVAPRPNLPHQGALSVGSIAAASPPPHQVSPPLHSQAHLGGLHSPHHHSHQQQNHSHLQNPHQNHHQNPHHSPHHSHMQQQLAGHPLGMTHPAAITQGYPLSLQSEYQTMGGGMLSSRVMMSSPVDYHQLGRPIPGPPGLDWGSDYHGSGGLQRDKPLFLS
ncbi:unnamed protein product [Merluccius merluccius]